MPDDSAAAAANPEITVNIKRHADAALPVVLTGVARKNGEVVGTLVADGDPKALKSLLEDFRRRLAEA